MKRLFIFFLLIHACCNLIAQVAHNDYGTDSVPASSSNTQTMPIEMTAKEFVSGLRTELSYIGYGKQPVSVLCVSMKNLHYNGIGYGANYRQTIGEDAGGTYFDAMVNYSFGLSYTGSNANLLTIALGPTLGVNGSYVHGDAYGEISFNPIFKHWYMSFSYTFSAYEFNFSDYMVHGFKIGVGFSF